MKFKRILSSKKLQALSVLISPFPLVVILVSCEKNHPKENQSNSQKQDNKNYDNQQQSSSVAIKVEEEIKPVKKDSEDKLEKKDKGDLKKPEVQTNKDVYFFPKDQNSNENNLHINKKGFEKPEVLLNPKYQKELKELKFKLQAILESKTSPFSKEFLVFINEKINQIDNIKNDIDFLNLHSSYFEHFLEIYNAWKRAYLNSNELITTIEDKNQWNKAFAKKLNNLKKLFQQKKELDLGDYLKDFYIYKLKQQIKLYEQHPYYLQPLERLKKLLYHYQNNYNKYVNFQWGIDKNNNFSLDPSKYYSGNYNQVWINDKYVENWLKYYQRWNWIFINKEDQIAKIKDEDIKALQIDPKFKNKKVLTDYINRQINFAPDNHYKLWTINEQHPEKVNYNDVRSSKFETYYDKKEKISQQVINEINKLNLVNQIFELQKDGIGIIEDDDKKSKKHVIGHSIKNFNYKKFWKYQKYNNLNKLSMVNEGYNVYNNLLWKEPNLFSDGSFHSNISKELAKVKNIRSIDGSILFDKIEPLSIDEAKKIGKDLWINPTSEYKRWFNHWKEVLPKIINKKWNDKTKIRAVAYYIVANTSYLVLPNDDFNYNGYGFYNPTQIFTNDPEIKCVGYSMNLSAALTILNIPVRIVGGPYFGDSKSTIASGFHAWNEVFVDGRWKVIDLTNWDLYEGEDSQKPTYELRDDVDLFLERNSEHMNKFKLDLGSYETTLMYFKNPKEYEYLDLPDSL
ncbi:Uncharacterised protein [Mycoplasmopsis citelli]|uniref:Transglutaminase-like domain-containing protein n=1 Tax=Mycoplasmopsis citelli TaxID=171281 RepID=A0A449B2V7_9BACT|nr:transglutaminase-like domain-containing protein [Mycoplasmopsis citelli]VEU74920.1 Uncharacterised protein [Mycoplasmopsis citelli]